ncbi:MAG: hypothetical protein P8X82_09095 [Gemmatimonadales bacterium]|jgi:hypothetical protein
MFKRMFNQMASVVVGAVLVFMSGAAPACGESLFHVGKGVTFRDYTAPLPGKILIVARTEGELILAERLAAAGHNVRIVADANEIGAVLADGDFDIVMTLFAQRQIVEAQMRSVASNVSYLPVAQKNTPEEAAAKDITRYALSTGDSIKHFLRSIHRTLKSQRA